MVYSRQTLHTAAVGTLDTNQFNDPLTDKKNTTDSNTWTSRHEQCAGSHTDANKTDRNTCYSRPVENHCGARENIIAGPYPPSQHSVCRDWDAEGVEREETWGEVSPHHPTRGSGERRKLPQRGPGRSPAENGFYAYFRPERSHLEHHFQYFHRRRGPPNVTGPGNGKTPAHFPPCRRACISAPVKEF